MYHPPSKRTQLIRRVAIYSLMSTAVVVLVVVLVFVMLGYRFNGNDGRIEQGGLVQFDSKPSGANIAIDGTSFGALTPSKTTMTSGQHVIIIGRSGYSAWQKSIDIVPGSVLWLNYIRLVPNDLTPSNVASFATVSSTAVSPDNKWMAVKEEATAPAVHLINLTQDQVVTTDLQLPADSYTHPSAGKPQSFSLEKWDADSRYILVKHAYDEGKTEWIVLDSRDVSLTKNITKLLDIAASKVVFSGDNSRILYAQIGTDIRKIDLGAATLSRPLVTNVAEFSIYDRSTIVYSTLPSADTKMRSVGYYKDGADKAYTIRTYSDDGQAPLHIAIGTYFGDTYEAVAYGSTVQVLKGDLPTTDVPNPVTLSTVATMTMPTGTHYVSILTDGRFIISQNDTTYKVYDLELKRETTTILKGKAPIVKELAWLDGYTLWSDQDNMLRLYEFDGANQHDIMPVTSGFSVTLSPNSKYLYGIIKSHDNAYHLERVQMVLQ